MNNTNNPYQNGHVCGVMGCTFETCTQQGIELHRRLAHGHDLISDMSSISGVTAGLGNVNTLHIPLTQQIAFIQDAIFIQESLNQVTSS